jgi:predicted RNA-binding Zn ribbon-like protein
MPREAFRFDAGRISLDLMATLGLRCGELLPDPPALGAWLAAAGLSERRGAVTADELALARALRAALFGLVGVVLHGGDPSAEHVRALNASASVPAPSPAVAVAAGAFERRRREPEVAEALGIVARDAIELLTGPERAYVRECAAEDCSGIYLDTSRGHRRRWCSSVSCGNRARVAAHRARHAAGPGAAA